jgi:hypothetical protein
VITELRRYRIKPGRIESWLSFFTEAAREQEGHGIRVEYAGVETETDTFVWLRTFADETDRKARKDAFSDPWAAIVSEDDGGGPGANAGSSDSGRRRAVPLNGVRAGRPPGPRAGSGIEPWTCSCAPPSEAGG